MKKHQVVLGPPDSSAVVSHYPDVYCGKLVFVAKQTEKNFGSPGTSEFYRVPRIGDGQTILHRFPRRSRVELVCLSAVDHDPPLIYLIV